MISYWPYVGLMLALSWPFVGLENDHLLEVLCTKQVVSLHTRAGRDMGAACIGFTAETCTALQCTALQCTLHHCNVMLCNAQHCIALQFTVHCTELKDKYKLYKIYFCSSNVQLFKIMNIPSEAGKTSSFCITFYIRKYYRKYLILIKRRYQVVFLKDLVKPGLFYKHLLHSLHWLN